MGKKTRFDGARDALARLWIRKLFRLFPTLLHLFLRRHGIDTVVLKRSINFQLDEYWIHDDSGGLR
jgi:hypothetical protein